MDAVLFLKTISRMCSIYYSQCNGCPIATEIKRKEEYPNCYDFIRFYIEDAVEIVEKCYKVEVQESEGNTATYVEY